MRGISASSPQSSVHIIERGNEEENAIRQPLTSSILSLHSHLPSPKLLNPVPSLLTGNIPHAHSLIQASRHHQVLRWMELSAHHIVIMPRQHTKEKKQHREHQLSFTKRMVRENTEKIAVLNLFIKK